MQFVSFEVDEESFFSDEVAKWMVEAWELLGKIPLNRLRELAAAEREGRVVVLPCKVGDTVYVLTSDSCDGIDETKVNRIVLKRKKITINADCSTDDWGSAAWDLHPSDFGKRVFLSRQEAEDAREAAEAAAAGKGE